MKRTDLQKIEGLSKEQINSIMNLYQDDVTDWQDRITKLQSDKTALETSLKKYDGVDIDKLNSKVDELEKARTSWEAEKTELISKHSQEVDKMNLQSALDKAIYKSKTIDGVALKSHLKMKDISYDKDTDTLKGFDEQLENIKKDYGYLFNNQNTGSPHGTTQSNSNARLNLRDELSEHYKK